MRKVPAISMCLIAIPCALTLSMMVLAGVMAVSKNEWRMFEIGIGLGMAVLPYALFLLMAFLLRKRHPESVIILVGFGLGLTVELLFAFGVFSAVLPADFSLMTLPVFLWAGLVLTALAVGVSALVRMTAQRRRD